MAIQNDDKKFNQYLEPTSHISKDSSRITGLTINGLDLCRNGRVIDDTMEAQEGIKRFISWIEMEFPGGCILVAHNGKRFDFPILKRYLESSSLSCRSLHGLDSRDILKKHFPDLAKNKMESLVSEFLPNKECKHHDALEDAQNLSAVIMEASEQKGMGLSEFLHVKEKSYYRLI